MDSFLLSLIALVVVDGAIFIVALAAKRSDRAQSVQGFPFTWAVFICVAAIALHGIAFGVAVLAMGGIKSAFPVSVVTGMAPAAALAFLVRESFSRRAMALVTGGDEEAKPLPNMSAAAACLKDNDFDGAIAAYQEILKEFPEFPDPLFAIQTLLVQQYKFSEAAELCREIIRKFQPDDVVWTRACGLLSELLREKLDDAAGADAIDETFHVRHSATKHGFMQGEAPEIAATKRSPKSKAHAVHDMEQARRLLKRGELDAAVDLYRRCQRDRPHDPKPFMEAATALELDGQHQESLEELQRAARAFSGDSEIWCELALRMSGLYSNYLDRPDAARDVLNQVKTRALSQKTKRLATERMAALEGN